jgi:hypothetical protein
VLSDSRRFAQAASNRQNAVHRGQSWHKSFGDAVLSNDSRIATRERMRAAPKIELASVWAAPGMLIAAPTFRANPWVNLFESVMK